MNISLEVAFTPFDHCASIFSKDGRKPIALHLAETQYPAKNVFAVTKLRMNVGDEP